MDFETLAHLSRNLRPSAGVDMRWIAVEWAMGRHGGGHLSILRRFGMGDEPTADTLTPVGFAWSAHAAARYLERNDRTSRHSVDTMVVDAAPQVIPAILFGERATAEGHFESFGMPCGPGMLIGKTQGPASRSMSVDQPFPDRTTTVAWVATTYIDAAGMSRAKEIYAAQWRALASIGALGELTHEGCSILVDLAAGDSRVTAVFDAARRQVETAWPKMRMTADTGDGHRPGSGRPKKPSRESRKTWIRGEYRHLSRRR